MIVFENGKLKFKLTKNIWDQILEFYRPTKQILESCGNLEKKDWSKGYITLTANQANKLRKVFSLTRYDIAYEIRSVINTDLVLRSVGREKLTDLTFVNCKRHIARADLFRKWFFGLREELELSNTDGIVNMNSKGIKEYLNLNSKEYRNAKYGSFTKGSKLFYLREKIERLGCLVFQTEARKYPIDKDEVSGIFVSYENWPVIILNSKESSHQRRIFTLLHELYHFLKTKENKTLENRSFIIGKKDDEKEANQFAVDCLFPKDIYMKEDKSVFNDLDKLKTWLKRNLKNLGVSEKAQMIRLKSKAIVDTNMFKEWEEDYRKRMEQKKKNTSKSFGINRSEINNGKVLGTTYISLVYEAYNQKIYNMVGISDFLNVRILNIADVFSYWMW